MLSSVLFFTLISLQSSYAEGSVSKIQLNIRDNLSANAEYFQGDANKPVILILHGFMLTHNFHTVKRLAESLHESGYNILIPTLSLGINKRVKSLPCEAIHVHSLQQDLEELDQWVNWLAKKSKNRIILIGHSTGSLHLIWYLSEYNVDNVNQAIFLSIPDFGPSDVTNETVEFAEKARQLVKDNNDSLQEFGLSYCKKYATTASDFLSYYNLSKSNTFERLKKIKINKTLIYGTQDKRIDKKWNQELAHLDMDVITIESANHFFDFEHEFDLLDNIEAILGNLD